MQDDERLTSLTKDEESAAGSQSAFDRRMQIFALAALLGACLLWVAGRAVLHRTVAAPAPSVSTLARGVLAATTEGSQALDMASGDTDEQQSQSVLGASDLMSRQGSGANNGPERTTIAKISTGRQSRHNSATTSGIGASAGCSATMSLLSLNQATASQLDALPGVGPVLAQRIIAWRSANKGFSDVHELQEVPGIGPAKFARIRSLVRVR